MANPVSLLGDARAFARDFARDRMPRQFLWDIVDYVPIIIDANPLTGRGGWLWGSTTMGGDALAGILGNFTTIECLLVIGSDNLWYEIDQTSPFTAHVHSAAYPPRQNPVQGVNQVFAFDGAGAHVPQVITCPGGTFTETDMHTSAPHAPLGTVYKDMVVVGGVTGSENTAYFSVPNTPLSAWDSVSNIQTARAITAMGSLRATILIFHAGAVERIRGSIPPHTDLVNPPDDDMFLEGLFDRVGCTDPKTIAYWNDNCIFADEHGVHVTDGATVRNLTSQGSILSFWRNLWATKVTAAGCTFMDYYIVTVRTSGTPPSVTLICDMNRRQWFRFSNVYALSYITSSGGTGMERVWAGMAGTHRLGRLGPAFFPTFGSTLNQDDDGTPVLPVLETAWYRMGKEGRKRSRFAYLSYDSRTSAVMASRRTDPLEPADGGPPEAPLELAARIAPVLSVDYITGPSEKVYTDAGGLPPTTLYSRFKLPIWHAPYGLAFRVQQTAPTTVTRIYDLAMEAGALEASRE